MIKYLFTDDGYFEDVRIYQDEDLARVVIQIGEVKASVPIDEILQVLEVIKEGV